MACVQLVRKVWSQVVVGNLEVMNSLANFFLLFESCLSASAANKLQVVVAPVVVVGDASTAAVTCSIDDIILDHIQVQVISSSDVDREFSHPLPRSIRNG